MSKRRSKSGKPVDVDVTRSTARTRPKSPSEAIEPARAPSRPRRRVNREPSRRLSGFARFVSTVFTIALAVMLVVGGVMLWFTHEFEKPGPLTVGRTFGVPKGEGPIEIAARLERDGIISSRWAFVASHYVRVATNRGKPMHLKAGEYEVKKGASLAEVHAVIVGGKSVLSKITLPEGLTSAQIVERIRGDDNFVGDISEIPPEGALLPDTYRFSKGMERQELIDRMRAEQQRFLTAIWEKRQADLPIKSPEEAMILASIVEKETGKADERDRVAAVFVNRLRKGMRLQSDPTIIYGLVGGKGSLGRAITRADIDGKTPFNTYQINGLPPTPICNPGRSAIEATLDPAKTSDLYFVADGSGGHAFSESLKAHNAAVANWRKIEKEARADEDNAAETSAAAPPAAASGSTRAVSRPAPPPTGADPAAATSAKPALPTVTTLNAGTGAARKTKAETAAAAPVAEAVPAATTATDANPSPSDLPLPVRKPKR